MVWLCKTKKWWICKTLLYDSFIVHVKTKDICEDIAKHIEIKFDTSDFELDRPSPKGKNKKVTIKGKKTYLFKRKQWWR